MDQKKRHHFVPKAYMNPFCNKSGRVLVYRKDGDGKPLPVVPNETQHQRYYYSQPKPDGGMDNNTLENLFGDLEGAWPPLVERIEAREDVNDSLEVLFNFMALQRARVPACRDAVELMLAATVKNLAKQMHQDGQLPPLPEGCENLLDELEVSIDPHQSIHAMVVIIKGVIEMVDSVGWVVFHNNTNTPFLTSDNPVAWFDPSLSFSQQKPYSINPDGPVIVQFPISPKLLLIGATEYRANFVSHGLTYGDIDSEEWVECVNAQTCRFGYEAVISNTESQSDLIASFADISPVHVSRSVTVDGSDALLHTIEFGSRLKKPKWQKEAQVDSKK